MDGNRSFSTFWLLCAVATVFCFDKSESRGPCEESNDKTRELESLLKTVPLLTAGTKMAGTNSRNKRSSRLPSVRQDITSRLMALMAEMEEPTISGNGDRTQVEFFGEGATASAWNVESRRNPGTDSIDVIEEQMDGLKFGSDGRKDRYPFKRSSAERTGGTAMDLEEIHPVYLGYGQETAGSAMTTLARIMASEQDRAQRESSMKPKDSVRFIGK